MRYKYSIKSNNGNVSGTLNKYNEAVKEANLILNLLFPSAVLSEKLNDIVSEPNYLVYEHNNDFVYLKVETYDENDNN